jgi:serine/threonine-protein kinase
MTSDSLFADRYRLERRLGLGGMATVQLALDTRLQRHVAVKLLADHLAADSNFVSRFRREALAAARLVHPNIVQVFDFGSDEATGRQYIVMEFVDGPSCADILRELGRVEPGDAVSILTQACRGLDYAHRHGVVHRDVKPGNLLRGRDDGQLKLADFGIAKAAEDSDMTKVGSVLGTAAYLSPEQARGEPAGPASDLYALGVVSYQLLAGRLPFEAASLTDLARQQELGAPPLLHEVDSQIPRQLALVVARALERDPGDRFADAAEMDRALADSMRGIAPEPTAATRAIDDSDATRRLEGTAITTPLARTRAAPRKRRMEPIAEPQRRAAPRRAAAAPAPAPAPARARATQRRRSGGLLRFLRTLLIVALLAGIAAGVYVLAGDSGQRGVQLREQVEGNVDQAVDEIQTLIEDNTRR